MPASLDLAAADRFDLTPWIADEARPGAVAAVLSGGKVVSWTSRGRGGVGADAEVLTPDTVFYVASVSKQFTAACVTACEIDGRLDLDASVRAYIPELNPAFDPVTPRHLLHHLGGLPREEDVDAVRQLDGDWYEGRGLWDLIEIFGQADAMTAPPGQGHAYSNEGYWLLAACVERASGLRFGDFARQRLFTPLNMSASRFRDDPDAPQPGLVIGHAPVSGGWSPVHTRFHGVGDGGLLTTIADLARWDQFWSGRSALGSDIPDRLLKQGRRSDGADLSYARGVSVRGHRGLRIISHGGSFRGYLSKLVRFPEQDFSVACLANADDVAVDVLTMALADAVLGDAADMAAPSWADTYRDDALAD